MMYGRLWLVALLLIASWLLAGCSGSTSEVARSAAQQTQEPATGAVESGQTSQPTPTPNPTPVPTQPLAIVAQGYGAGTGLTSQTVGYAFIIENPNADQAAENVQYQVAAYDDAGVVLKTDSGSIPVVWPTERLGVGNSLYLSEGQTIARLDVQVRASRFEKTEPIPTFTMEGVTYRGDRFSAKVVGVIKSPYTKDLSNVRISAVAYDAEDNIIGGGFTFVDFIPAIGQAAAEVSINAAATPARVELYPALSNLSIGDLR